MSGARANFHADPSPHFVLDSDLWESLTATSEHVAPGSKVSGVAGYFNGTPVYLDACPWEPPDAA